MRSHANRGKVLEKLVEMQNEQYKRDGLALIQKVPTEWIPIRNRMGKIVSAKVERKSTVDFTGITGDGRHIEFDCKMVSKGTRFDFSRIEKHQLEHLKMVQYIGGVAGVLIWFVEADEFRWISIVDIKSNLLHSIKSIHSDFMTVIKVRNGLPDYLELFVWEV